MSGVGYFRLGYVLVWVDFRLGSFRCGICRKWFGVGYVVVWVMSVWDKLRHHSYNQFYMLYLNYQSKSNKIGEFEITL